MKQTREMRRQDIKNTAAILINEKGYHAMSMRDLSKKIGVEPATLYSYFDSKEAILWELALDCANEFLNSLKPIYESALTTRRKLQEMIIQHVITLTKMLDKAEIFVNEWKHLSEQRKQEYAILRDNYEAMFRNVIEQGIRENEFVGPNSKFATLTVLSALNWTYQWFRPDGPMTPKEIGEQLAQILLHGLIRRI